MRIDVGGKVPFVYELERAERQAKGLRLCGVARDVVYGLLVREVIQQNLDCDVPDSLLGPAIKGLCEEAVTRAFGCALGRCAA